MSLNHPIVSEPELFMSDTSQPLIVILETPLTRGDMTIAQLEIRDIFGRDCAGLSLAKMSVSNYDEFRTLLPRVCDLLEHEIDLLASDDLVLVKESQTDELEATLGDRYQRVGGTYDLRPGVKLVLYARKDLLR